MKTYEVKLKVTTDGDFCADKCKFLYLDKCDEGMCQLFETWLDQSNGKHLRCDKCLKKYS